MEFNIHFRIEEGLLIESMSDYRYAIVCVLSRCFLIRHIKSGLSALLPSARTHCTQSRMSISWTSRLAESYSMQNDSAHITTLFFLSRVFLRKFSRECLTIVHHDMRPACSRTTHSRSVRSAATGDASHSAARICGTIP